jgi:hypothetical protein
MESIGRTETLELEYLDTGEEIGRLAPLLAADFIEKVGFDIAGVEIYFSFFFLKKNSGVIKFAREL